jgi:hypothetical protein
MSRALALQSTEGVMVRNFSIGFSVTRENNLVHFSETKDVYFFDTKIENVTNDSPSKNLIIDSSLDTLYVFSTALLTPYPEIIKQMWYKFNNTRFVNSTISLINIESVNIPIASSEPREARKINIQFDYLEVKDIVLKGKDNLVKVAPIVYKDMIIRFTTGEFSQVRTSLGSIFDIKLNTDSFNLDSCLFLNNQGRLFQFRPSEVNKKDNQLAVTINNT